ncbi:helix-turn-helix domain-containing protein [uncultured Agrococcus sp.]|uniref:ArsR/SmtB family transcription factor n=1 Tax=uncultured Agrococcus sp. TaxID=382258 RepID=UPI0025D1391C|nr:helix-turn-helix domain-containing protein [uncultured Agrococcus sp.]
MGADETTPAYASKDALRAMSHPVRIDILQFLRHKQSARAADLAEALGVAANSMSYHLRILAKAGLIEEAPDLARDRRDRVWRMQREQLIRVDAEGQAEGYRGAVDQVGLAAIEWIRSGWIAQDYGGAGKENLGRGTVTISSARLTFEEAQSCIDEILAVIDEYSSRHRDADGNDLEDDNPDLDSFRIAGVVLPDVGRHDATS